MKDSLRGHSDHFLSSLLAAENIKKKLVALPRKKKVISGGCTEVKKEKEKKGKASRRSNPLKTIGTIPT